MKADELKKLAGEPVLGEDAYLVLDNAGVEFIAQRTDQGEWVPVFQSSIESGTVEKAFLIDSIKLTEVEVTSK